MILTVEAKNRPRCDEAGRKFGRRRWTRRLAGVRVTRGWLLAVGIVAIGLAVTSEAAASTQQVTYSPFSASGQIIVPARHAKKGECFSQSLKASRPGVVRCFRHNEILDPCFKSPKARHLVVCVYSPSSVAVRLKVPHVPKTRGPYLYNAWAVTVAAGECPLIAGATTDSPYGRLNYGCPGNLVLFGDPIPSNPNWVIWAGYDSKGADASQIPIATVWR